MQQRPPPQPPSGPKWHQWNVRTCMIWRPWWPSWNCLCHFCYYHSLTSWALMWLVPYWNLSLWPVQSSTTSRVEKRTDESYCKPNNLILISHCEPNNRRQITEHWILLLLLLGAIFRARKLRARLTFPPLSFWEAEPDTKRGKELWWPGLAAIECKWSANELNLQPNESNWRRINWRVAFWCFPTFSLNYLARSTLYWKLQRAKWDQISKHSLYTKCSNKQVTTNALVLLCKFAGENLYESFSKFTVKSCV